MSKDEIKYEINKVLDHFPGKALVKLLNYLKQIESGNKALFNPDDLNRVITEDKHLLEKLAK